MSRRRTDPHWPAGNGKTVLVVGGAGYIGAHACLALSRAGYRPVVFDNLSNGHVEFARWGPLAVGDIRERSRIEAVIRRYRPAAILHFAGLIEVGQSMADPASFYETNAVGSLNLLAAAHAYGISAVVFSSTCATFGEPQDGAIDEDHPQRPLNPYGWTKLFVEQAIRDFGRYPGFRSAILRYFNAAGAEAGGTIGEWHEPETHLVPAVIAAARGDSPLIRIHGDDYRTRDGTCIRDYVHVCDLAEAHVRALDHLLDGGPSLELNLGTGRGTSVLELIAAVSRVSGRRIEIEVGPRRAGDAALLVARPDRAEAALGWRARHGLDEIVASAWAWHEAFAARRQPALTPG